MNFSASLRWVAGIKFTQSEKLLFLGLDNIVPNNTVEMYFNVMM